MRLIAHITLALTLSAMPANFSSISAAILDDEFAVQCGALYAVLEKAHIELGDEGKSRSYGRKFQRLGSEVEKFFENTEQGRTEAADQVQKHADNILAIGTSDRKIIQTLTDLCDKRYEEFTGLEQIN